MNALIVSPIAKSDKDRLGPHMDALEKFGPYNNPLLVVVTSEAYKDMTIKRRIDRLKEIFPADADVKVTDQEPRPGWPCGPNQHWQYAVKIIAKRENALFQANAQEHILPWLWMESDFYPIRAQWNELLARDYQMAGMPYMGNVVPTYMTYKDPQNPGGEVIREEGEHMVGCGFFPPYYLFVPTDRTGKALRQPQGPPQGGINKMWNKQVDNIPFDVRCQGEHVPCYNNPRMLHKWRTKNYRISEEDGQMYCDNTRDKVADGAPDYSGLVDVNGAFTIHGCQDDSLTKIILAGQIPNSGPAKQVTTNSLKPKSASELLKEFESTPVNSRPDQYNEWRDRPSAAKRPLTRVR